MELSLNIYSQIGIVMLIGLAAKNGILIVEFANQLRDKGVLFEQALINAAQQRLRPIVMTTFTTVISAVPLVLASGPGAESRMVIGVVILREYHWQVFLLCLLCQGLIIGFVKTRVLLKLLLMK